jgi:hypothetical protein
MTSLEIVGTVARPFYYVFQIVRGLITGRKEAAFPNSHGVKMVSKNARALALTDDVFGSLHLWPSAS